MRLESGVRILAALSFFLLPGCASLPNLTASMHRRELALPTDAFVYGRFSMIAAKNVLGGHPIVGLDFACEKDGTHYNIGFSVDAPLQVIEVSGGNTCSLESLLFATSDESLAVRQPAPAELRATLRLEPGTAYYLGDFSGACFTQTGRTGLELDCKLLSLEDDYEETTAELRSTFRGLSRIPTRNTALRPRPLEAREP